MQPPHSVLVTTWLEIIAKEHHVLWAPTELSQRFTALVVEATGARKKIVYQRALVLKEKADKAG